MFSICSAMALASNTPTQIGSTFCPSVSRRMMIGIFVIGSTIRPLMFISIIATPRSTTTVHRRGELPVPHKLHRAADRLAPHAVWAGPPDDHLHKASQPPRRSRKVHHRVAAGPPRQLPLAPPAGRVDQHLFGPSYRMLEEQIGRAHV